jgi:hypothetical protein
MSVTLVLIPMAVAIGMSLGSSGIAALLGLKPKNQKNLDPVETIFNDASLLVKEDGENEYRIETQMGVLHYFRASQEAPFSLEVRNVGDMDELLGSLQSLENEYGRNVQAFTYAKVMESLSEHGMAVASEEVLEDDSILLTINT